ncbi:MAG: histidine phosphatase family protein [Rhabdochlamydiaceae bacterium]
MTDKLIHLIFIRHGNTFEEKETPYHIGCKTDKVLTSKGRDQIQTLATYFKHLSLTPEMIYTGSLLRQRESAAILQNELGPSVSIKEEQALNELDFGLWEGVTQTQIQKEFSSFYEGWIKKSEWPSLIFPKPKEFYIFALKSWLKRVFVETEDKKVVMAITSQSILRLLAGLDEKCQIKGEDLKVPPSHFCTFTLTESTLNVLKWNEWAK